MVAAASALLALLWVPLESRRLKYTLALTAPFVLAMSLYWMPVWMGEPATEYAAWWGLFLLFWGPPGALASLLVVSVADTPNRRRAKAGDSRAKGTNDRG